MKLNLIIALLTTLIFTEANACDADGKTGFLPENDMYLPADMKSEGGITEEDFNAVIDEVSAIYTDVIKKAGGKLKVNRLWDNGTVNASAQRRGRTWVVNMYGGLARKAETNRDGFALVLCHELGHHLGGFPIKAGWASNEGQSDTWAVKCFERVYQTADNASILRDIKVAPEAAQACNQTYKSEARINLCKRASMAGLNLGTLLAAMGKSKAPKFNTPSKKVVKRTNNSHPAAQCRLDSYFSSALCDIPNDTVMSNTDPNVGSCTTANASADNAIRRKCWYAVSQGGSNDDRPICRWFPRWCKDEVLDDDLITVN